MYTLSKPDAADEVQLIALRRQPAPSQAEFVADAIAQWAGAQGTDAVILLAPMDPAMKTERDLAMPMVDSVRWACQASELLAGLSAAVASAGITSMAAHDLSAAEKSIISDIVADAGEHQVSVASQTATWQTLAHAHGSGLAVPLYRRFTERGIACGALLSFGLAGDARNAGVLLASAACQLSGLCSSPADEAIAPGYIRAASTVAWRMPSAVHKAAERALQAAAENQLVC